MELDEDEAREEANKAEDFKKLQEEVAAAKPKGTVRAGPPQIERYIFLSVIIILYHYICSKQYNILQ